MLSSFSGCTTFSAPLLGATRNVCKNSLVTDGYIPKGRAMLCRKEWTQLNYGWWTVLEPHLTDTYKPEAQAAQQQALKDLAEEMKTLPDKVRQIRGGQ